MCVYSVCLSLSIHPSWVSVRYCPFSLTCLIFNKWIARFLFSPQNSLKLLKLITLDKALTSGPTSPSKRGHQGKSARVLTLPPRGAPSPPLPTSFPEAGLFMISTNGSQALPKLPGLPEWLCSCIVLEWIFTEYLLCAKLSLRWWDTRGIHSSCPCGVYGLCLGMSTQPHLHRRLYTMIDAPTCTHTGSQIHIYRRTQPHSGSASLCKHLLSLIHVWHLN